MKITRIPGSEEDSVKSIVMFHPFGGSKSGRRIYGRDEREAEGIRVQIVRPGTGTVESMKLVTQKHRTGTSEMLRPLERSVRKLVLREAEIAQYYLSLHKRSNQRKRNGWMKDLPRNIAGQQAARWDQFDPEPIAPDVRAGVMGLGNLGHVTATMMRDFGFPVAGWSASRKDIPGVQSFAGMIELDEFLARTDMLVMMLPDTAQTRGIMNARTFAVLPKGAGVVNAGRGPQLVLADLIVALDTGHLHGAFLDVFDPEPPPAGHPVWTHPRIIMTPHNAAFDTKRERSRYVAHAILAHERGESLPNLFQPARGY